MLVIKVEDDGLCFSFFLLIFIFILIYFLILDQKLEL